MGLSNAMRASQGQRPTTAGTFGAWSPANVAQVAAGYFWLAASASGIGTVLFKVPEGGAHTTFDLIQAVVANQPTVLTELGGTQFRMRRSTDPNPSSHATLAAVTAGWTGATYFAGWFRLPDAAGIVTNTGFGDQLFSQSALNQRRITVFPGDGTPDTLSMFLSPVAAGTGNGTKSVDNANVFAGANWVFVECVFDPLLVLGGSANADKFKFFTDLTLRSIIASAGTGITGTTIADTTAAIAVACLAAGFANGDTTDWCTCYYANGIPSLPNREALRRHLAPA